MKKLFFTMMAVGLMMAACNHSNKPAAANTPPANLTTPTPSAPVPPATPGTAATTTGAVASNGPTFKFENDTHDFGKIQQGDKVTYKFNFANIGKSPLIIQDAVASCGCTIPVWPKQPIKPGDGGQIVVTFNSTGKMGLQDKMITITANTNPSQTMVHLVGEVTAKK